MTELISVVCEDVGWKFKCAQQWDDLALTDDENMRFCGHCSTNVFYCGSFEELVEKSDQGLCVAFVDSGPDHSVNTDKGDNEGLALGRFVSSTAEGSC